jgi:uncharacterized repeat protein (TIGR03803 family)
VTKMVNKIQILMIYAWAALALPGQTLTTLYSFDKTDGYYPAGMVQATDGNLYGVTTTGGTTGSGTIFRLTPDGALTTLYQFCPQTGCPDGSEPYYLLQASDGNLYGATASGGANQAGTVFRFSLTGALTKVYDFCSQSFCSDGATPIGGLIQGIDGNLYGTTTYGGNFYVRHVGYGTVFKMTLDGALTTLYRFCKAPKCPDGAYPYETLMQAANGNIYGTTSQGGDKLSPAGTVFEITPDGKLTTRYKFLCDSGCPDGYAPMAGLTQAANGDLYSTTSSGGRRHGGTLSGGTVFRMTSHGALKTIATFDCFSTIARMASRRKVA